MTTKPLSHEYECMIYDMQRDIGTFGVISSASVSLRLRVMSFGSEAEVEQVEGGELVVS